MDRFPQIKSTGICSCRSVNGGSSWSHHAECRALDTMLPTGSGGSAIPAFGDPIIELLGPHGRELGIDHEIWNRRIWSNSSPNGRVYTGAHPHYDHHHIGLTRGASNNLTYATLVKVLGPADPENPTIPIPGGSKLSLLPIQYGHGFTKPPADSGLSGDQSFKKEDVKLLQKALGQAKAKQDGVYGNGTTSDVKAQTSSTDGKLVGADEWEELNPGGEGTKGDKGDTGATGMTGAAGTDGDDGAKGDKGDQGTGLEPGTEFEFGQKAKVL